MYTRLLHATDLQKNHYELCEKAKSFASAIHAELYLVHVIEIPPSMLLAQNLGFTELVLPATEDAKLVLKTVGDALNVPVKHQFVEIGLPKYAILERAASLKCDLVMLGRHASGVLPSLLGSTTYHVMQHAECDVLTLK